MVRWLDGMSLQIVTCEYISLDKYTTRKLYRTFTKNFNTMYMQCVIFRCSAKGENVDVKTLGQDEESGEKKYRNELKSHVHSWQDCGNTKINVFCSHQLKCLIVNNPFS